MNEFDLNDLIIDSDPTEDIMCLSKKIDQLTIDINT